MSMFRSRNLNVSFSRIWTGIVRQRGKIFGYMIFGALIAFELFNFSTTRFALEDVLGDLSFLWMEWATILAIAFCGIDFAGIARIFTPEQGRDEPAEVWYLFGAWLLAAGMNAMLTWWGVSVAIETRQAAGTSALTSPAMMKIIPVFVAVMVWVIRVLIIGTFSVAGERLFQHEPSDRRPAPAPAPRPTMTRPTPTGSSLSRPAPSLPNYRTSAPRPAPRPEPTYHNTSLSARPAEYEDNRTRE